MYNNWFLIIIQNGSIFLFYNITFIKNWILILYINIIWILGIKNVTTYERISYSIHTKERQTKENQNESIHDFI